MLIAAINYFLNEYRLMTFGWIDLKLFTDIHGPQGMQFNNTHAKQLKIQSYKPSCTLCSVLTCKCKHKNMVKM